VPKADKFALPATLNDRQIPAFELREPFFHDAIKSSEFSARLRKNASLWGTMLPKHGKDRFRAGAGLRGHSFGRWLLPVEKYYDEHPEYFAEVSGKRIKTNTQPCMTNPDVQRIVAENLLKLAATDHEDCWFYAVAHDDNKTVCQCANCRAVNEAEGTTAAAELQLVNYVADELAKVYPDKFIKFSAYEISRRPPKTMKVRPNVFVDLCPIECDFSRPIPESSYFQNQAFVKDIQGWSKLTDHLYVFDYVTDFGDYFHPFPNLYALQGNIKFFLANKVRYLVEEGIHDTYHGDFAELKTWVLAKLMWNPDQDVDKLIDRFLAGYYGKAAPFVRQYIDELHALPRDPETSPLLIMEKFYDPVLPDAFLERALGIWRQAEGAVRDEPVYRQHVRLGALSVTMTILQRNAYRFCAMDRPFPDAGIRELAKFTTETIGSLPYKLRLGEGGTATMEKLVRRWRKYADPSFTWPATDRVVVEAEDALTVWGGFKTGARDDPQANGGKALRYSNAYSGDWVTYLPMECFGHVKGATYRVRMRARIDPTAGGEDAEVFDTGLSANGKGHLRTVKASELGTDYRWIDLFDWTPAPGPYLYIAFGRFDKSKYIENPAAKAMWIDQLEFVRITEKE